MARTQHMARSGGGVCVEWGNSQKNDARLSPTHVYVLCSNFPPNPERRWTDPVKWHADKMAEDAEKRAKRNDPVYLAQKREEGRLR